jgi:hypothetical protein
MSGYAEHTKVSVGASKAEIEATLNRFGIHDVLYGTIDGIASVMFRHQGRSYVLRLTMPDPQDAEFWMTPAQRHRRSDEQAYAAWEQACRVKWREIALLMKAKLVAVSSEAVSFEDEFLAYTMLPDRSTMGEWAVDQLEYMCQSGQMPELLPGAQKALTSGGNDGQSR